MDDAKTVLFSLLLLITLTAAITALAEVEYISPQRQIELETMFDQAKYSSDKDNQTLKNHEWKCDMYGVRTRLQVHHDLKLYKWKSTETGLHNDGAQLVSEYKVDRGALVGTKANFEDRVKLTVGGQLVSRLALTAPQELPLAYSVCNREAPRATP